MRSWLVVGVAAAGLFLPVLAAVLALPSAAVAPDVAISLLVDVAVADPQDLLTYTIWLDNGGPQAAPSLWVNDTFPTGATYVDDTAATDIGAPVFVGRSPAGNVERFQFANYPAGNLSFKVRARVGFAVTDGQVLQNTVLLWYTNATGVPQPTGSASAQTTISIPVIFVTKTGAFTAPNAITYTITVSNTGSGAAARLWWNDSLPSGLQYAGVRAVVNPLRLSCVNTGPWVNCTYTGGAFLAGSKGWYLDATIPTPLTPGSTITNRVFVNYTDSDGTSLSEVRASFSLTIATANLQAFMYADVARVPPGGTIGYTIFYNNSGQISARDVWINDTLPTNLSLPAVTFVSATPVPAIRNQSVVKWQLSNVPTGVHYVTLLVSVLPSLGDGAVLTNTVTLDYTDGNGNPRAGSTSNATSLVAVNVPAFVADLVANKAAVPPGGTVAYTLFYNNSRPALAAFVVVEIFLPPGIALASSNPVYTSSGSGKFIWNLTNVGSGEHRIAIVADVPTSASVGTVLRTVAFVNYTDDRGTRVGGAQTSADVTVFVPAPPYLLYAGIVIAIVVVVVVARLYISASEETVIDDVFLLHKDGLLIKHYTRRLRPDVDSDVLSGMLIAVQNFVNESFIGEAGLKKEGLLDELKFGQYRILLTRGRDVIVAAVVSGPRMERVPAQIQAAIGDLEAALGPVLSTWEGDMEKVAGADKFMQDLIAGKYRNVRKARRANH